MCTCPCPCTVTRRCRNNRKTRKAKQQNLCTFAVRGCVENCDCIQPKSQQLPTSPHVRWCPRDFWASEQTRPHLSAPFADAFSLNVKQSAALHHTPADVCACAPTYPNQDGTTARMVLPVAGREFGVARPVCSVERAKFGN